MKQSGLPLFAKRVVDRTVALVVLGASAPILGASAIAVALTIGRPVMFQQVRPGFKGRPFRIYKLRTMTEARDAAGTLLPDAERLTRLGRILRATSIDDLPNLFNVLQGDLSLVGPRPLLTEYLDLYTAEEARRHDVLPGITGWAQVHGRNNVAWEEKFKLDVWYVDHWSLGLDVKILARTVCQVLRRDGISSDGHTTTRYGGTPQAMPRDAT